MPSFGERQVSAEFLVAEFSALQDQVIRLEEAKSNRVNFFLIVVAAVTAGVSGSIANPNLQHSLGLVFICIASMVLLLLGVATLNELVRYSESIVSLYRRAGRIRRWFVDFDPEIAPYLAFEATDEHPKVDLETGYLTFRGGDAVVLMLNSVTFCVLVIATLYIMYPISVPMALFIAAVAAFLFWFLQQNRLHALLRKIEIRMEGNIRFPYRRSSE